MNKLTCFRVNAPDVVHEIIEGEAVIVNLAKGSYYSLDKIGAEIWDLIVNGLTVDQIVDAIAFRYKGNRDPIQEGVHQLLERLQQEQLIAAHQGPQESVVDSASTTAGSSPQGDILFEKPKLNKYTDMEDLLLLDPIHDVDETGWPNVNPKQNIESRP